MLRSGGSPGSSFGRCDVIPNRGRARPPSEASRTAGRPRPTGGRSQHERRIYMSRIYLPVSASRGRLREAEHARKNRVELVRELSWGRVTRRDLIKMGLFTTAGLLAPIRGLSPFAAPCSTTPTIQESSQA